MINLNAVDVNELIFKLSSALFNMLDGTQNHDIKGMTGCTDSEVAEICEMRKIAQKIAFEGDYIPLDMSVPKRCSYLTA